LLPALGDAPRSLFDTGAYASERGIYDGAVALQNFIVEKVPPSRGNVGFWYGTEPEDAALNSVQSAFFFGYSRLHALDAGMPAISPSLLANLTHYRYLALLGWTTNETQRGLDALSNAGMRYVPIETITMEEGPIRFEVHLIELKNAATRD
jgi:hypothetical protein